MKRYLIDDDACARSLNLEIRYAAPVKHPLNPLLREEYFANPSRRWEPRYDNGYPYVFFDPDLKKYRCYISCFAVDDESASTPLAERPRKLYRPTLQRVTALHYAESEDGVNWLKPDLGVCEFEGSSKNNLILLGAHGASVFRDAREPDPAKRYKMCLRDDFSRHMGVRYSADGIRFGPMIPWRPNPRPLEADTFNYASFDPKAGLYRVYTRSWGDGVRLEYSLESRDFETWNNSREVLRGAGKDDQIYAMPVFWQDELCFGLPLIIHGGDQALPHWDKLDTELCVSRDGLHFTRVLPGTPLIPRGAGDYPDGEYDCGGVICSPPLAVNGDTWFYYLGSNGRHTSFREGGLCLARFALDQVAGYAPRDQKRAGFYTTMPLERARLLRISAALGKGGRVRAWAQPYGDDFSSQFLQGWGGADGTLIGEAHSGYTDLPIPASTTEKWVLCLEINEAAVYSYELIDTIC